MKKYFLVLALVIIYSLYLLGDVKTPVEEVDVIIGEGYDINSKNGFLEYELPFNSYVFRSEEDKSSITTIGRGRNIEEAIQSRSLKRDKKYVAGLERVCFISEEYARNGIRDFLSNKFNSTTVNDMAYMIVVNGKSEDYLKVKSKGYVSSADYADPLIKNIQNYNFFSDNYKIIDALVRVKSEGRQLVIPYADIEGPHIEIKGLAIFQKDKMVKKINMEETLILNLLREEKVKGILSLQQGPEEYTDYSAVVKKRKVKCYEKEGKYTFDIDLLITGEIISNDLYKGLATNVDVKKKFEKDMARNVEKMCNQFISKMQNEYKIDCLELGSYGAAKFGRRKDIDWDKIVCNSKINVKVKVKVDKQGRGDY